MVQAHVHVHVYLDFDGVLAIPWSCPEIPFSKVPYLLKQLHKSKVVIHLTSFNPKAYLAIKRWGCDKYFTGIRAGSNESWNHNSLLYYTDDLRENLLKSTQISSIRNSHKCSEIQEFFFDDDEKNIKDVCYVHPEIVSSHIKSYCGLTEELLIKQGLIKKNFLSYYVCLLSYVTMGCLLYYYSSQFLTLLDNK